MPSRSDRLLPALLQPIIGGNDGRPLDLKPPSIWWPSRTWSWTSTFALRASSRLRAVAQRRRSRTPLQTWASTRTPCLSGKYQPGIGIILHVGIAAPGSSRDLAGSESGVHRRLDNMYLNEPGTLRGLATDRQRPNGIRYAHKLGE